MPEPAIDAINVGDRREKSSYNSDLNAIELSLAKQPHGDTDKLYESDGAAQ